VRPGSHSAGDRSFGQSAGIHAGKAFGLVAAALLIGVVLLHHNGGPVRVSAVGQTTTTARQSTSTTVPGTTETTALGLRAPADIKVLVANGTTVGGLATRVSDKLHNLGYNTLASTNTSAKGVTATVVYYGPGYQQEATVLATQQLGLKATAIQPMPPPGQVPVANLNGANIVVIAGADLGTGVGTGTGPGSTTATTRHVTATTHAAATTTTVHH
jgi:hypothetical protein